MATRSTAEKAKAQPQGKVRRSQMLTTYGPGALVDLLDFAVIINGLDAWRFGHTGFEKLPEPRLRDRIAARLKGSDVRLSVDAAFRLPPAGDDADPSPFVGVTARLFPRWFVCQNPRCRTLTTYKQLEFKGNRFKHDCGHACVPVRFVQACASGHIDDLNWVGFVHQGEPCAAPELRLDEGRTGDFAEVKVECVACERARALRDLKVDDMRPPCRGKRPWLGPESDEACTLKAALIMRTASNAYFSQLDSALTIPDTSNAVHDAVEAKWNILSAATPATLPVFRTIPEVATALDGFTDKAVLAAVELRRAGARPERPPIRIAEHARFMEAPLETPGVVAPAGDEFFARRADIAPIAGVERVVLAHKLREVRVQVGFTRLDFPAPTFSGEHDLGVRTAPLGLTADWLPAIEVFGEGVFLALDQAVLKAWEARPAVRARGDVLQQAHDAFYADRPVKPPFPGVRLYMLHSLAHLLMTAISLECGYSASAIHERIYCLPPETGVPMAAILLSTSTPGSEGTLGGLVEEGRAIRRHLERAIRDGSLCSNDPVCGGHDPFGAGDRRLDGAACHGCQYVAESSCELFNRYLDRALVVPTLGQPVELAYFRP